MSRVLNYLRSSALRFAREEKGHAAVEFAMVALPFFLLTFGLAEVAMIGFAQTSLDHAVSETARRIRTGQAQNSGTTYAQIEGTLCTQVNQLLTLTCAGNLYLDVDTFASFVSVQNNSPITAGNLNTAGFGYSPGSASSIVVVRAYYRWHILTPFFQSVFSNMSGGQRLLVSTMMFRNEPY